MSCGSVIFCNKRFVVGSAIGFGMMASISAASANVTMDSLSQLIAQKSEVREEIKVPPARISTQSSIRRTNTQPTISYGASSNSTANSQSYSSYPAYQNSASYSSSPSQPSYAAQSDSNQSYSNQSYSNQGYQAPSSSAQNKSAYNSNISSAQPKRLTLIQSAKTASASPKAATYPTIVTAPKVPAVLPAFLRGSGIAGNYDNVDSSYLPLLSQAESQSSRAAREVLATARAMALNERTIIKGGCWDYLNAVFNRAGVTKNTILKGAYKEGPYANPQEIQVGDWLYYINHGYNDIEHSGLFVGWVDEANKQALILSYAGESRHEPARYKVYDLSHVYHIMRPVI